MGNLQKNIAGVAVILIISLLPQSSLSQRRIDPELQAKIDDFINTAFLPSTQTTGLGLAIVQGDGSELFYSTGYGHANIEKGIPNGNATQFLLGSITKSFTSVLSTKILHEKFPHLGESVLDTPISQLLPGMNLTLIDRFRSEQVSFRDLLGHRVCVWDQPLMADPFNTTEEIIFRARYNWETCKFRTWHSYSNQMYVIAGHVAGLLANKSYEAAMQDFWNEAGMLNTAFMQKTDDFSEMPFRSMPYYVKDGEAHMMNTELTKRIKMSNAAGGIYVTPDDMTRYMRLHLNLGQIDGVQVLPREVMEWVRKPSGMLPYYSFKNSDADHQIFNQFGYGLGLVLSSFDGWEYVQHAGYYGPYSNLMSMMPGKNLAIYTGMNMGPIRNSLYILHGFIFETLRGNMFAKEKYLRLLQQTNSHEKEDVKQDGDNDFKTLYEKFVGRPLQFPKTRTLAIQLGMYGSGSAGELELSERFNEQTNQTQLFVDYGVWYKGWLELHEGETVFRIHWVTDVIQDNYSVGQDESHQYAGFDGDYVTIWGSLGHFGTFQYGVELDEMPRIPWEPNSCGIL